MDLPRQQVKQHDQQHYAWWGRYHLQEEVRNLYQMRGIQGKLRDMLRILPSKHCALHDLGDEYALMMLFLKQAVELPQIHVCVFPEKHTYKGSGVCYEPVWTFRVRANR